MLVLTPRMRNSRKARCMRCAVVGSVRPQAVTLTSMLSKKGEMRAPAYALPASRRIPMPPALR